MPVFNFRNSFVAYGMTSNVFQEYISCLVSSQEAPHLVTFVEPQGSLKSLGNANNTSYIRALLSFTLNLSTESPITIVSK